MTSEKIFKTAKNYSCHRWWAQSAVQNGQLSERRILTLIHSDKTELLMTADMWAYIEPWISCGTVFPWSLNKFEFWVSEYKHVIYTIQKWIQIRSCVCSADLLGVVLSPWWGFLLDERTGVGVGGPGRSTCRRVWKAGWFRLCSVRKRSVGFSRSRFWCKNTHRGSQPILKNTPKI